MTKFLVSVILLLAMTSLFLYALNCKKSGQLEQSQTEIASMKTLLSEREQELQSLKLASSITNSLMDELYSDKSLLDELQTSQLESLEALPERDWSSEEVPAEFSDYLNNADKAYRGE